MRFVFVLVASVLFIGRLPADALKAKAAIAIAIALQKSQTSGKPAEAKIHPKMYSYADGYHKAVKEEKALVVHVGQVFESVATEMPGCVHSYANSFQGVEGKGIVVGIPDQNGGLYRIADLSGDLTADKVLEAIKNARALPAPTRAPVSGCSNGRCFIR
jgi:hypothetical protein